MYCKQSCWKKERKKEPRVWEEKCQVSVQVCPALISHHELSHANFLNDLTFPPFNLYHKIKYRCVNFLTFWVYIFLMDLIEKLGHYINHCPFFMRPTQFIIDYHDFFFHVHAEQWVTISAGLLGLRNQQGSGRAQHHRCEISGSARRSCGPVGA